MVLSIKDIFRKYVITPGERSDVDDIVSPVLFVQKMFGPQMLDPNWSWTEYTPFIMFHAVILTYTTLGTIFFFKENPDFNTFIEVFLNISVIIVYPIKWSIFTSQRSSLQTGYVMSKTIFLDLLKTLAPDKVDRVKKLLRWFVKMLFISLTIPAGSFMSVALWHNLNGPRVTLSRVTSTLLPMTTPYYEICFAIHLFFLFSAGFGTFVIDFWFVFLLFIFFEICNCAVGVLKVEKAGALPYDIRLNDALRNFYKIHVMITEYLNLVKDIFKWLILIPMITEVEFACLFLLALKTSESFNVQLTSVVTSSVAEMFAYCCLGEYVKSKANEIRTAFLNFDWTSMRVKDQKSYLIIFCFLNNEISIKSAIGIDLSFLTMSSIFKMSYQVFTVVNTMD